MLLFRGRAVEQAGTATPRANLPYSHTMIPLQDMSCMNFICGGGTSEDPHRTDLTQVADPGIYEGGSDKNIRLCHAKFLWRHAP